MSCLHKMPLLISRSNFAMGMPGVRCLETPIPACPFVASLLLFLVEFYKELGLRPYFG